MEICDHPKNIVIKDYFDAPYKEYEDSPRRMNKSNHCEWYEPKKDNILVHIIREILQQDKKNETR